MLTNKELEVLEILWSTDKPLSRAEIVALSGNKWSPTSIHAFLNGLIAKGVVQVAGFFKLGKSVGRTYEPIVTKESYMVSQMVKSKPKLANIVSAFLDDEHYDKSTIDELEAIIQQKKREWGIDS